MARRLGGRRYSQGEEGWRERKGEMSRPFDALLDRLFVLCLLVYARLSWNGRRACWSLSLVLAPGPSWVVFVGTEYKEN
jgi:hypothetical protein